MNAPDKLQELLTLTREPFPASTKVHVEGSRPDIRVPMREIALTNGERVTVYDTSGPYTDPTAAIDIRQGLAPVRAGWIEARGDTESYTGRARVALDDGGKNEEQAAEQRRHNVRVGREKARRALAGDQDGIVR